MRTPIPRPLLPLLAAASAACSGGAPLEIRVAHPAAGHDPASVDSAYVIGSVGDGRAALWINGTPVVVAPGGGFLAFLPLPPPGAFRYDLTAVLDGDTVRARVPLAWPRGGVVADAGGAFLVDTASLWPRGPLLLRGDRTVPVHVRAAPDAEVRVRWDGGLAPLPPGPPGDPLARAAILPVEALRRGSVLEAWRGGDTVRLSLGPLHHDGAYPRWVRTAAGGPGGIAARAEPGGPYRWFLLPGTRLEVTGWSGELARVRLGTGQAWLSGMEAVPASPPPAARLRAGPARLAAAGEWIDLRVPVAEPPAYRVDEADASLTLTLYGTDGQGVDAGPRDPWLRGVRAERGGDGARYVLALAGAPYGYRVSWSGGVLTLRVRRPPAVDPARPLRGLVIAVDPGHPPLGATGPTGLREAGATLPVGLRLAALLERRGARVVLTRSSPEPVGLDDRLRAAEQAGAHALVSLHFDALPDSVDPRGRGGTATYYFHPHSLPLATAVQRALVPRMGLGDQGVPWKNLAMARPTWMPAVLSEGATLVIPEHEAAIRTGALRDRYAEGVAAGLENYFRGLAAPSGPRP